VYEDLNSKAGRDAFSLDDEDMKDVSVLPFRVRPGDDASCLNLNRAQNPQLTGVSFERLAKVNAFTFASGSWETLNSQPSTLNSEVVAVADQATAMWGLGKGVGDVIEYDVGSKKLRVKIAALLAGSVLQGKIIIDEKAFIDALPDVAGYRFFLIDAPTARAEDVSSTLTQQLEQRGLALESTATRLNAFNAVQNTYIGIFTVLGGLGVLLGTAGIGVLVARHVLERKGELGLMQAVGFTPGALRNMVIGEHSALLLGGVFLGVLSAALAVWPNLQQSAQGLPIGFLVKLIMGITAFGLAVCAVAAAMALRGRLVDAVRKE
jgi:ABC-type antimicrobial peptide transport system permease subunit